MNANTLSIKSGDTIKTVYGDFYTVARIVDNVVFVTDSIQYSVHITKIIKVIAK